MPSVPPPAPTQNPTLEPDRMARVDGCPDCVLNTETPYRVEITADGFVGYYGCTDCGWFWNTAWRDQ